MKNIRGKKIVQNPVYGLLKHGEDWNLLSKLFVHKNIEETKGAAPPQIDF